VVSCEGYISVVGFEVICEVYISVVGFVVARVGGTLVVGMILIGVFFWVVCCFLSHNENGGNGGGPGNTFKQFLSIPCFKRDEAKIKDTREKNQVEIANFKT
jgi:hypothetical protein